MMKQTFQIYTVACQNDLIIIKNVLTRKMTYQIFDPGHEHQMYPIVDEILVHYQH